MDYFNQNSTRHWSWTIENFFVLSIGLYIASVFVFSYSTELNYISQICFVLMAFCCLLYVIGPKKRIIIDQSICWFISILILSALSIVWSFNKEYAIGKVITVLQLVLMGIVIYLLVDNRFKIKMILNTIILSGYFMYLYTFQQMGLSGIMNNFRDNIRLGTEINQENAFGYYSVVIVALILYFALYQKQKKYYFLLPIPIIMIALTGSKKGLLLLMIVILFLITFKQRSNLFGRGIFAIIILFIVFVLLYNFGFLEIVFGRLGQALSGNDMSTEMRQLYIEFGLEKFKGSPLWGYGIEHFCLLFGERYGSIESPHNNYIQIMTSFGIIGLILWYRAFWKFFKFGVRRFFSNELSPLLVLLVIIYLVNDITTTTLTNKFSYILVALCFSMMSMIRKEADSINENE